MARYLETLIKSSCGLAAPILDIEIKYPVREISSVGDDYFTLYHTNPSRDLPAPVVFYMRPALKSCICDILSHRTGLLQGRPGVGKSLLLWWRALSFAQENPLRRVIWLNDFSGMYTVLHNNRLQTFHGTTFSIRPNDFFVIDAIESSTRFYDCYRTYNATLLSAGYFVLIASDVADVKHDWLQDSGDFCVKLPHWTLEEYKHACNFPPFFNSVKASLKALTPQLGDSVSHMDMRMKTLTGPPAIAPTPVCDEVAEPDYAAAEVRNELIDRKYFYAGHSVRYMFGSRYDVQTIIKHVLSYVRCLYFFVFVNESDIDARVHLYFDHSSDEASHYVSVPVSQFAMRAMCENMSLAAFADKSRLAEVVMRRSPSLDEQVLKIDVEQALRRGTMSHRCSQIIYTDGGFTLRPYTDTTDFSFNREQDVASEDCVPPLEYDANTCFYLASTLPGSFDSVQLLSRWNGQKEGIELVLRFLQATRAFEEDIVTLRLDLVTRFAAAFNKGRNADTAVVTFEVMVVTTADRALDYKCTAPVLVGELAGWDESQLQVFQFTRAHELPK